MSPRPVVATGQQIGAGWSPALSVAKALAALAEARRSGGEAVYWLADEDHDRAEVANVAARVESIALGGQIAASQSPEHPAYPHYLAFLPPPSV